MVESSLDLYLEHGQIQIMVKTLLHSTDETIVFHSHFRAGKLVD